MEYRMISSRSKRTRVATPPNTRGQYLGVDVGEFVTGRGQLAVETLRLGRRCCLLLRRRGLELRNRLRVGGFQRGHLQTKGGGMEGGGEQMVSALVASCNGGRGPSPARRWAKKIGHNPSHES